LLAVTWRLTVGPERSGSKTSITAGTLPGLGEQESGEVERVTLVVHAPPPVLVTDHGPTIVGFGLAVTV
jgi:hypothetical protein